MGATTARDEALGDPLPTWYCQEVLDAGRWPDDDHGNKGRPITRPERKLLHDLVVSRREVEGLRIELESR